MTTEIKSVVLSTAAHESIRAHAPESTDGRETGGILLGHLSGDIAHIEHAGDAGPKAVRTPTFFLRDLRHAQQLADAAFAADGSQWIGDWHTHVDAAPAPSRRDMRSYRELLHDAELQFATFISVIVTVTEAGIVAAAWVCDCSGATAVPLSVAKPAPDGDYSTTTGRRP